MNRKTIAGLAIALLVGAWPLTSALAIGIEDVVDGGNTYAWQEVQLPDTMCGNGSQYKFYVYDSPTSNNLLLYFEGGGACWDYPSCSGQAGILGAAHPNGIPDNYIAEFQPQYVSPLVNGADPGIPVFRPKKDIATKGYDVVYMPYCTGDVHVGNNVVTYTDPAGVNPPITWRHVGYNNTRKALDYLHTRFPTVGKLLVSGFSAGGTATNAVYYQARRTLLPTVKGYMLNDSGPIFPAPNATYKSRPLHVLITAQWALASLYAQLPATFNPNDFGSVTAMLAAEFPTDQLAYTGYSSDFNYSRFSYERFYPGISQATILAYWRQDQANLVNAMKVHPQLQLSHSVAPPDQRQPLLLDHHLHREPRLLEHPEEVLVRDPLAAVLEVHRHVPADRDVPPELAEQQPAAADRRDGELLQQRGPGDGDRGAADQRRHQRVAARATLRGSRACLRGLHSALCSR